MATPHHVKGIEVYREKLIVYGCGDFIDDYEGISGYEEFRDDLVLMYFPVVRSTDGTLAGLDMVPLQIRNMRLHHALSADVSWARRYVGQGGQEVRNAHRDRPGPGVEACQGLKAHKCSSPVTEIRWLFRMGM